MSLTPKETMERYFEAWRTRDFDRFQALLAEDVSFRGPLGAADDAASFREALQAFAEMSTEVNVRAMAADGQEVISIIELHTTQSDEPLLQANWSTIDIEGKVKRVRVMFDPRPLLD